MKRIIIFIFFISGLLSAQKKTTHIYAIKGKDTLRMDVYTPKNIDVNTKLPVLLWMHGGGFSIGARDSKEDAKLCADATKYGYIGVSISYRLLRKNVETQFGCACPKEDKMETFKQAAIDYLDAAAYIVDNANLLQVDASKIIAGGSSAGAESILNAAYMRTFFIKNLPKYEKVKFAGIFSVAGAVVNANYITKSNALPSVLYHGTDDNLVPFANMPHHLCAPERPGYLMLDGSKVIVDKLDTLEMPYYFNIVKGGKHEIAAIPFKDLEKVFKFFDQTILKNEIIQTKVLKTKTL